jgi:hypothetical protein
VPGSKTALSGATIPKMKLKTKEISTKIIVSGSKIKNP